MYGVCDRHVNMVDVCTALRKIYNKEEWKIHYSKVVTRKNYDEDITNDVYFNNSYYRPMCHLLNTIRHTTDIGIFPRITGMHPIEFIKLKHKLQHNDLIITTWNTIVQKARIPNGQKDITLDEKLITVASIMVIIKQYLKCNNSVIHISEGAPLIIVSSTSVALLTSMMGWELVRRESTTIKQNNQLIADIIKLAIKQVVSDDTVIKIKLSINDWHGPNLSKIALSTGTIRSLMPDSSLFMTATRNQYYFVKTSNNIPVRTFIKIQLNPYDITDHPVNIVMRNLLLSVITHRISNIPSCEILQNTKIEQYSCNNWHDMLMEKVHTLSDQQESVHLSLQTLKDKALYDNLIGIKNADTFLDSMVRENNKFYTLIEDGITISTDHQCIKNDMFIAFAAAHMIELLIRCGMVLTEEVFSAIFGISLETHHMCLLHRGIIFRGKLYNLKNKWIYNIDTQEIRVAQKTALQLLCTYFQGLDKLVLIKPADVKIIPNGYSNIIAPQIVIDKKFLLEEIINISDEVELREYPIQLAVNFTNSLKHSTNIMLSLQQHIYSNKYIGIADVVLTKSDMTYGIDYLATNKLAIFQYFTGFDSVENFKDWVVMLFRQESEKGDLVSEILHSDKGILYKANRVFIILFMVIMRRDCRMLRIDLERHIELCFKDIFEYINCNELDRLHKYAQVLSAYMEYESLIIKLEPNLDRLISKLYSGVLPGNPSTFSVGEENGNVALEIRMGLILHYHRLNMTSKLDKMPRKQILNGKLLKLIPWTSSNYKKIGSDDRIYHFTGRIPDSVVYLRHGYTLSIDNTPIQQRLNTSNNLVVNPMIQPAVTQTTAPCPKNLKRLHDSDIVPVTTTAIKSRVYEIPNNIGGKGDNIRVWYKKNDNTMHNGLVPVSGVQVQSNITQTTTKSIPITAKKMSNFKYYRIITVSAPTRLQGGNIGNSNTSFPIKSAQTQSNTESFSSQSVTLANRQGNDVVNQDKFITPHNNVMPQIQTRLQVDDMQGSSGKTNVVPHQNNHTEASAGYSGSFPMSDLQIQSNTESFSSQSVTLANRQGNDVVNQDKFITPHNNVMPQIQTRLQVDDMQGSSIGKTNVVPHQNNHTEASTVYNDSFPMSDSHIQSDTESFSDFLQKVYDTNRQGDNTTLPPNSTPHNNVVPQIQTRVQVDNMQSIGTTNRLNYHNNNTEASAVYNESFPMSDSHIQSDTESFSDFLQKIYDTNRQGDNTTLPPNSTPHNNVVPQIQTRVQVDNMQSIGTTNRLNYHNNNTEASAVYNESFPMSDSHIQSDTESFSDFLQKIYDTNRQGDNTTLPPNSTPHNNVVPQIQTRVQVDNMQSIGTTNRLNYHNNNTEASAVYNESFPMNGVQQQSNIFDDIEDIIAGL